MPRVFALLLVALVAQPSPDRAEIDAFRKSHEAEINNPTGWVALVGLHWLAAGAQTVGRDASNAIVLNAASAPARLGTLVVGIADARLQVAPGVDARVKGQAVTSADLRPNVPAESGVSVGSLTMVLIKRGDRFALRVWDRDSPARQSFTGLAWAPIDPAWRVLARWTPHLPVSKTRILNVLGETIEMTNPGVAVFTIGGREYRLEALLESDDAKRLFFIIRDGTSGKTTYDAGRYLYTPLPQEGHVTLDFNKAENPPCAFTPFATCPLPPSANRLILPIAAGELYRHK